VIAGVGIDAAGIDRTKAMIDRFGPRFTSRVFTEAERKYCDGRRDMAASYAARFAAKEAVMKALGSGWGSGVRFIEIEIQRAGRGEPRVVLHGGAGQRARELGVSKIFISLTHENGLAIAQAVAESG